MDEGIFENWFQEDIFKNLFQKKFVSQLGYFMKEKALPQKVVLMLYSVLAYPRTVFG
jgi:hypothetical protein